MKIAARGKWAAQDPARSREREDLAWLPGQTLSQNQEKRTQTNSQLKIRTFSPVYQVIFPGRCPR